MSGQKYHSKGERLIHSFKKIVSKHSLTQLFLKQLLETIFKNQFLKN
jgi:hypothetical protein